MSSDQSERPRWQWPRFSIRELLVVTAALAALWGLLAMRLDREEMAPSLCGSFVLLWALVCWRTVRLNQRFFGFRRHKVAANRSRSQDPPAGDRPDG